MRSLESRCLQNGDTKCLDNVGHGLPIVTGIAATSVAPTTYPAYEAGTPRCVQKDVIVGNTN